MLRRRHVEKSEELLTQISRKDDSYGKRRKSRGATTFGLVLARFAGFAAFLSLLLYLLLPDNSNLRLLRRLRRFRLEKQRPIRFRFTPKYKRTFYFANEFYPSKTVQRKQSNVADYNGLDVKPSFYGHVIEPGGFATYEKEKWQELERNDFKKHGLGQRYENDEDYYQDPEYRQCRRNYWQSLVLSTCNTFHEQSIDRMPGPLQSYSVTYLSHGAFRDSFHMAGHDDFVWKSMRLKREVDYNNIYQFHKEAIIMERLSSSPRIVDIFGYCGTSIFAEHMAYEVSPEMIEYDYVENEYGGYMKQEDLDEIQKDGKVHPMNSLTNDQKLDLAIVMAESIADIHGYQGGVIVHGDIHPVQWLKNKKGQVKLNDFNNGEILTYNSETNEYCKIYRCYGGTYRSPEEFRCIDSNESQDTYSFGNNVYVLLIGLWPFYQYDPHDSHFVQNLLIENKEKPFVDPRYRNRSEIESGLIKIMEQCWEWDLDKRIPIFDVVRQLHELRDSVRGRKG